jgi:hypothetical protein
MAKKRPPTAVEREQILKALKPGQIKHYPQFDMTIRKPRETGISKLGDIRLPKSRAKVIRKKKL